VRADLKGNPSMRLVYDKCGVSEVCIEKGFITKIHEATNFAISKLT
jgi:hypothetical protein